VIALRQSYTTMSWFKLFWKANREPLPRHRAMAQAPSTTHVSETYANFTPRAQQVLALARKEADRFNHNFVGTEHLLLGLIALGQGVAVNVLQKMGLDLLTVRDEVEKQVGTGPDQKLISSIPYTPRVKKVLALASTEAKRLNHTYIGTEHILLGLLREGDGVAARVLKNLDVAIEQVRIQILQELDPNFEAEQTQSPLPTAGVASPAPTQSKPQPEPLDTTKRYDVYCSERCQDIVVYRNALFKGVRSLFGEKHRVPLSEFFEVEQADGHMIFIARYSVIKICESGASPAAVTDK